MHEKTYDIFIATAHAAHSTLIGNFLFMCLQKDSCLEIHNHGDKGYSIKSPKTKFETAKYSTLSEALEVMYSYQVNKE